MNIFTFINGLTVIAVIVCALVYATLLKKKYSGGIYGNDLGAALADFFLAYFVTVAAGFIILFTLGYDVVYKFVPPFVSQWLVTTFHLGTVAGNHEILSLVAGLLLLPVSAIVVSLVLMFAAKLRNAVRSLRVAIVDGIKRAFLLK